MTQPAHGWRSHYALLMLLFVYTMSFIDRQIMGILVQPIKLEFGVSDTVMGVLTGLAFAVFYRVLAFIWTLKPYAAWHLTLASTPRPAALLAGAAS